MGAGTLAKVVPVYMFTDGLMCGCVGSSHACVHLVCVLGPAIRLMLGACLRSIRVAPLFLCVLGAAAAAVGRGCGRGHTR